MKFKKYTSIENSSREEYLARCVDAIGGGHCVDDFVVEEKAHGANFAIYYDGTELKTACRSGFLDDDGESFCKSHLIKRRYAGAIKVLYSLLGFDAENKNDVGEKKNGTAIRVVGELIGGSYEHPDVKRENKLPRIQKGVDYCPGHEFYAFDLNVLPSLLDDDTEEGVPAGYSITVDKLEMNRLFEAAGLFYAKPLIRGTLEECLAFDNTFKSHIPGWLGLSEHPAANIAEGKVVKPVNVARTANGSRIILKDKTEIFSEVRKPDKNKNPPASMKKSMSLSERGEEMVDILFGYITANRLSNVLSKIPDQSCITAKKDLGRICGLLTQDAFEEFNKDHAEAFEALDTKEIKRIKKCFGSNAMKFIQRTRFENKDD